MKIAFLTELPFKGKVFEDYPNMRTEFSWMLALEADHYNIYEYNSIISDYDVVIIIFPKGKTYLNAEGVKLIDQENPISELLSSNFIDKLKERNKKIFYMQEGPHWWFNNYELVDQINFYNMITSCDGILVHNQVDLNYYKGMYPTKSVYILPTLMIDNIVKDINPQPEDKVIIGGNFARWYGGFESYMVAQEFDIPIWGQTSHAMREGEDQLFHHLPRVTWVDWMKQLSSFKYAVHLMPTVAAGTFSLNCAYFGIPCIGNIEVDTQKICHPDLSVEVSNIIKAKNLAKMLIEDKDFYNHCGISAKENYNNNYKISLFKQKIFDILYI